MAGFDNPRRNPVRRVRANSTPAVPTVLPGMFDTPSIERADIASLRGSRAPLSPLTSLSNQTAVSEALRPSLYSEVASRNTTSSKSSDSDVNPSGLSNIFHSMSLQDGAHTLNAPETNEVVDVSAMSIDDRLWKEVKYSKRVKGPLTKNEPLRAQRGETATTLNDSQRNSVEAAVSSMTVEQLDRFARRMNTVAFDDEQRKRPLSRGEGSSKLQGKTVDPHNWGAVDIGQDELDPEYQRKAFEFYSKVSSIQNDRNPSTSNEGVPDPQEQLSNPEHWGGQRHSESAETLIPLSTTNLELEVEIARQEREVVLAELAQLRAMVKELTLSVPERRGPSASAKEAEALSDPLPNPKVSKSKGRVSAVADTITRTVKQGENLRPVNQVAPTSYLGKAFASLGRLSSSNKTSPDHQRSLLNEVSGHSNEGSSSSSSETSDGDDSSTTSGSDTRSRKKKRKLTKKKVRAVKRPTLKPREPTAYDGRADVQDFHKFMRESIEYVTGYELDAERYISTLSSFMKGKAYRFFSMQVSTKDPGTWGLEKFFRELFDFCFPVDFRLKVRDTLRNKYQGRLTVQEYVSELEELFMMAGVISDKEKVIKLWNGLHSYIQKELWRFELSPTSSLWEDVVNAATRFELAEAQDKIMRGRGLDGNQGHHPGPVAVTSGN
ncbi:hypothetical protein PHLCEN_2v13501, partial [Hermanssonia centrifuga]